MGIVEDLESAIDIVELVGKYSKIKKAGVNYKGLCPFPGHSEKTPSFMVSPVKQIAYCFGCHKGGGPVKFMMDIENTDFKEAIEILGNFTGIKVNTHFDQEKFDIQKNLYSLYKDAVSYYSEALERYPEIKKYLMDRGLTQEALKKFHFGYADSGIELYNYLKNKGYDDTLIDDSMIFLDVKNKKDKFINRIIFPIQNLRGDFVALAGRIIGQGEPKYLNSPASKIYDKSSILYGLYDARHSITKENFIIITEGYMDTISLQEAGFLNTVAVSGTALTEKHLTIIKRLTHKIFLCFDNDNAGEKATKSSLELLKNKGFEVKIISLKGGKDPDEIIKEKGSDAFAELIKNAKTPIGFYIEKSNFNLSSIDDKKKLLQELLNIVKSYSDNIEKDFYLKEIAKLLDINMKIVYDLFNRTKIAQENKTIENDKNMNITSEDIAICYILLNDKNRKYFQEKLVFKEGLSPILIQALEQGNVFLQNLELSKKERYKGLSLKIEEENRLKTDSNEVQELQKLSNQLNKDIYKKEVLVLKTKMNHGDTNAFSQYSELIQKAKKLGIK